MTAYSQFSRRKNLCGWFHLEALQSGCLADSYQRSPGGTEGPRQPFRETRGPGRRPARDRYDALSLTRAVGDLLKAYILQKK